MFTANKVFGFNTQFLNLLLPPPREKNILYFQTTRKKHMKKFTCNITLIVNVLILDSKNLDER